MLLLTREQLHLNFIQVYHPCILGGPQRRGTKSGVKTYARDHHDAPRGPWYLKVWVSSTAKRPNSCTARALRLRLPQGSSYTWWLVAVAKRNLLLPKCVGRWWLPSRDIGILP